MDENKYMPCELCEIYERSMRVCVGITTPCNVHLEEALMEESRALLDICKCRTKFGFICIILEIEINTFSKN